MTWFLLTAASLVAGGFPTKRLVARRGKVDLEVVESGNAGAGNATRAVGLAAGVLVAVVDGLKGLVPILVGRSIGVSGWPLVAVGVASVIGNDWPPLGRHRGGRGLATSVGVVLGLAPGLIWWPALWSVAGWRIGGSLGGFIGWGLLPLAAVFVAPDPRILVLTACLSVAMMVRRAQGNDGFDRAAAGSRVVFDDDRHAPLAAGIVPTLALGIGIVAIAYLVVGGWMLRDAGLSTIGVTGAMLLLVGIGLEFGAKWAFGELFREGLSAGGETPIRRASAFRAALVGSGVARLIPAGGAITPLAMAWSVRDETRGSVGAALRATVLNYAGLLVGTGLALLWVVWRHPDEPFRAAIGLVAALMVAIGTGLAVGAGRLRRFLGLVPARWRPRAAEVLHDRSMTARTFALVGTRVVFEATVLGLTLAAFGIHLPPSRVIGAFGASQLIGGLPGTPGGAGFAEAGLAGALLLFGVGPAVAPILAFRVISFWLPAVVGFSAGGYSFLRIRAERG